MNTVIYARYSSNAQSEQSIEGQLKECYSYAERNGLTVTAEYIDRAISGGAAENRPEFMRMIDDSASMSFQAILVYQLDRFARNRYDSATYKARLRKNGVRVISARETISEDASGVLTEAILEGMAEYFSRELSQKIKRGLEITAQKGLYTGNGAALGYKIVDRRFAIDEEAAPIVRNIFSLFLAGNRMADIMHYLNAKGLKTSKGNPYNKNSIKRILTNRRYLGYYIYGGAEIPDGVPKIIDDETFAQAQELLGKLHRKDKVEQDEAS
ncbi:MAG: recombinase family protein [Clostridiales bacterium]|nr:recombinase family protein [Clostridiales bacterium]